MRRVAQRTVTTAILAEQGRSIVMGSAFGGAERPRGSGGRE
jgi:hypothetical protein